MKSKKTRRTQSPEFRKRQILDATQKILVQKGAAKTTIDLVAKKAGIGKGTVYLYYASKQELLSGLQEDIIFRSLEIPRNLMVNKNLSWTHKLNRLVEEWFRFDLEHTDLYHILFHELAAPSHTSMERCQKVLEELLQGGANAGEFDIPDISLTTTIMWHAFCGPCLHLPDQDEQEYQQAIQHIQLLFRRMVGAENHSSPQSSTR